MSQADFWYVRFPDGRILRAASTTVLRQELGAGHIPPTSLVRRSPQDEWVALEWTREFADVLEELAARPGPAPAEPRRRRDGERRGTDDAATVGSRLEGSRLRLAGVRGSLDELLAALDSALVARKLIVGAAAGLILGVLLALGHVSPPGADARWRAAVLAVGLLAFDFLTAVLTRLTYVELATLRPARWREGMEGVAALTLRVVAAQLLVRGTAWGLIVLLRWLPYWLGADESAPAGWPGLAAAALALGMAAEALIWPVFFLWWLIPPLLAVEGCSLVRGLRQWGALLRRDLGRVFLYQTLAVGLGLLVTAPLLVLVLPFFLPTYSPPAPLQELAAGTRALLLGVACAPLLTYWVTANVFIYLNLRYGAGGRR